MANERYTRAKELAVDHLETFATELWCALEKNRSKARWFIADPYRATAKASNMALALTGHKRGAFRDFESGLKGDALDFVAYGLTGKIDKESRRDAVNHIEDRFGLSTMSASDRQRIAAETKAKRLAAEAEAARDLKMRQDRARGRFYSADLIEGTAGAVYFASRGVPLDLIPNLSGALRFIHEAEYWMDAEWAERADGTDFKVNSGPLFPAVISAMVDATGAVCANHFTFLKPDGSGKAPVGKAKLMYPETRGLCIRVTNGPSGLGAEKAAAEGVTGIVALTEGIEDALSAAMADCDLRCWAAGSLSGLLTVPNHASAAGWLVFKDNDWGKPEATAQFDAAIRRLKGFGKPVEVLAVPETYGKDINDAINT